MVNLKLTFLRKTVYPACALQSHHLTLIQQKTSPHPQDSPEKIIQR